MFDMGGKVAVVTGTMRGVGLDIGVSVKGVLFTVRAALPHLSHGGTAVIIGSAGGTRSGYGMSLYGGSKAALR